MLRKPDYIPDWMIQRSDPSNFGDKAGRLMLKCERVVCRIGRGEFQNEDGIRAVGVNGVGTG